jgi:hypothetical protein
MLGWQWAVNRKGCAKMRSWPNLWYYPQIYQKGPKNNKSLNYCRDVGIYVYRRGLDWWRDFLPTYTHDSELQAITTLSLIYTLYKSPQHPLRLFQPAVSSPAAPWQRLLTVEFLQLQVFRIYLHSLPCRTQMNWLGQSQSQSQSYVTIDGQSANLSWNNAPIWGLRPEFCYCQAVAGLLMWGAFSDDRTALPFIIAAGPRQCSHSRVRVSWDSWPYFTVSDLRLPQPGGPVPQEQGGPVIPPGTGFPFRRLLQLAGLRGSHRPDWLGRPSCLQDNSSARTT